MSNILKSEPLFNYFPCDFKKLSLSLPRLLTAKLKLIFCDGHLDSVYGPMLQMDVWSEDPILLGTKGQ
jgi:hypothetical protein